LTVRFLRKKFVEVYDPTLDDSYTETIDIDGEKIELTVRDTAGQDEYEMLHSTWINEGECFLVCFDLTNKASLSHAQELIEEIKRLKGENQWHPDLPICPIILVGCKCDNVENRKISKEVGRKTAEASLFDLGVVPSGYAKFAETHPYYIECSSKADINVKFCFETIVRHAEYKRENQLKKVVKGKTGKKGIFSSLSGIDQIEDDLSVFNGLK
jgi:small GTP-binding protein